MRLRILVSNNNIEKTGLLSDSVFLPCFNVYWCKANTITSANISSTSLQFSPLLVQHVSIKCFSSVSPCATITQLSTFSVLAGDVRSFSCHRVEMHTSHCLLFLSSPYHWSNSLNTGPITNNQTLMSHFDHSKCWKQQDHPLNSSVSDYCLNWMSKSLVSLFRCVVGFVFMSVNVFVCVVDLKF